MSVVATAWKPLRSWARDHAVQLRLCLRVTVAALATFAFSQLLSLPLGMWAILTAVIVIPIVFVGIGDPVDQGTARWQRDGLHRL